MNLLLLVSVTVPSQLLALHRNVEQIGCRQGTDTSASSEPPAIQVNVTSRPQVVLQVRISLKSLVRVLTSNKSISIQQATVITIQAISLMVILS